jgi:hypothetical protein
MKALNLTIAALAALICGALADPKTDATEAAQKFYDQYIKVKDPKPWVLKSPRVTAEFKKAYAVFMKNPESDPIIAGQDFPDSGFKASGAAVKGPRADVTMKSRDPGFKQVIKVHLLLKDGAWLIDGVNKLHGE